MNLTGLLAQDLSVEAKNLECLISQQAKKPRQPLFKKLKCHIRMHMCVSVIVISCFLFLLCIWKSPTNLFDFLLQLRPTVDFVHNMGLCLVPQ